MMHEDRHSLKVGFGMSNTYETHIAMRAGVPWPTYGTQYAAAMDVCAYEDVLIRPGETKMISTGVYMAPPPGFCILVLSRSGLATKGVFVTNGPGLIDEDYRGEIKVILSMLGPSENSHQIKAGDRIAQLMLQPVYRMALTSVWEPDKLPATNSDRVGGFGSTGT